MMGNKIESFMCLLMNTEYLSNLLFENSKNLENFSDVVDILENWEKFESIDDIKKIDNIHIQKAIKELEKNNLIEEGLL